MTDAPMGFLDHLEELRTRIIRSCIAVAAGMVVAYRFVERIGAFVAAALLTPSPDPWNQAVFAAPMIALYFFSIGISWVAAPKGADVSRAGHAGLAGCLLAVVVYEAKRGFRNAQRQWRWAA